MAGFHVFVDHSRTQPFQLPADDVAPVGREAREVPDDLVIGQRRDAAVRGHVEDLRRPGCRCPRGRRRRTRARRGSSTRRRAPPRITSAARRSAGPRAAPRRGRVPSSAPVTIRRPSALKPGVKTPAGSSAARRGRKAPDDPAAQRIDEREEAVVAADDDQVAVRDPAHARRPPPRARDHAEQRERPQRAHVEDADRAVRSPDGEDPAVGAERVARQRRRGGRGRP